MVMKRVPHLVQLSELASTATNKKKQRVLNRLKEHLPQTSEDQFYGVSPSDADLQAIRDAGMGCGKELASLHQSLHSHCLCKLPDQVNMTMVARLRLRNSILDSERVTFRVLFIAHPHQHDSQSKIWGQDTRISVAPNRYISSIPAGNMDLHMGQFSRLTVSFAEVWAW
ncbi:hypothetical protein BX600DRAFT_438748 [Xylariales sp. PMI_506]|nr:hypothetical protein BX600DRAFT_438748 [Xylariales sp. PMI_506]